MTGPLALYASGLAGELARLGSTEGSAKGQLGLAAHLSRWFTAAGGARRHSGPVVEESGGAAGGRVYGIPDIEGPGAAAGASGGWAWPRKPRRETPATPREALLEEYRCYLLAERGVQAEVALGYLDLVRPFVAHHHAAAGAVALSGLSAADVTGFLTAESRRLVPKTAQRLATALRSLLRSWHPQGLISGPLDGRCPRSPTASRAFPAAGDVRLGCLCAVAAGPCRRLRVSLGGSGARG